MHGQGLSEGLYEGEEGRPVKGELSAAAGVGGSRVGHGGELGAGEVVAVHGDEGGDGGGVVWAVGLMSSVEGCGDDLGEGCFACEGVSELLEQGEVASWIRNFVRSRKRGDFYGPEPGIPPIPITK